MWPSYDPNRSRRWEPARRAAPAWPRSTVPESSPGIVRLAKEYVRSRYEVEADPERILGPRFTLSELQRVHEAVIGDEIDRFVFRRAMKDLLVPTEAMNEHTGGRPAKLFRRKTDRG